MGMASLTLLGVPGIPLIGPGDDLAAILGDAILKAELSLRDGDVFVVAHKIVSKAEGRFVDLAGVTPSARAQELAAATGKDPRLVEVILSESSEILRHRPGTIIAAHRLGIIAANAGVDRSNVGHDDRVLLLPKDPDASCARLRESWQQRFGARLGVVIADSVGRAWRNGIVGIAIGVAGLPGLRSLVGDRDLFGRPLEVTEVAIADQVAAAATQVMGQAAEGLPLVLVRGLEWEPSEADAKALLRRKERDLFR
jgi:coenzyme F420-0:L-glutamate ligase/coenzyme F420-1:gamma-L-glutamate ligase